MSTLRQIGLALAKGAGYTALCILCLGLTFRAVTHLIWAKAHPDIPLAKSIRLAQTVYVVHVDDSGDRKSAREQVDEGRQTSFKGERVAILRQGNPLFAVFKASGSFHPAPPQQTPDCEVTIFTTLGVYAEYHFSYVSATGELGSKQDWCRVTPEFRKWLTEQIAHPPKTL